MEKRNLLALLVVAAGMVFGAQAYNTAGGEFAARQAVLDSRSAPARQAQLQKAQAKPQAQPQTRAQVQTSTQAQTQQQALAQAQAKRQQAMNFRGARTDVRGRTFTDSF